MMVLLLATAVRSISEIVNSWDVNGILYVRFEPSKAVRMKITVLCEITVCSPVHVY